MAKASDNPFPSILIAEGTEPSAPAAGKQRLYIDSTTHHLKRTDSSGTDVDIEAGGSAIPLSTVTTKGDLVVATGSATVTRRAVGSNGQVLTADSTQTDGVKWAAAPGGTPTFVGARAYRSAALSLSNTTVTAISFDAESFDSGTLHDNSTNPSRITVPTTGKYHLHGAISYGSGANGVQIRLLLNGATILALKSGPNTSGIDIDVSDIASLTAGDYVELMGYQSSGGSLALNVGTTSVYLAVALIGT